jgi:hypothetical protein
MAIIDLESSDPCSVIYRCVLVLLDLLPVFSKNTDLHVDLDLMTWNFLVVELKFGPWCPFGDRLREQPKVVP